MVKEWLELLPRSKEVLGSRVFLSAVCMFSPCLHRLPSGSPVSSTIKVIIIRLVHSGDVTTCSSETSCSCAGQTLGQCCFVDCGQNSQVLLDFFHMWLLFCIIEL